MIVNRYPVGSRPDFVLKTPIPDICQREKTIHKNVFGVISIFKDKRPEATKWITEVLPTMWIGRNEQILTAFWNSPENVWYEFDCGRKMLSVCSLENINPR